MLSTLPPRHFYYNIKSKYLNQRFVYDILAIKNDGFTEFFEIKDKVIEKCFLNAYRVLCADKATIIRNFMEKAKPILQESNVREELEKLNTQEHDLKERLKKLLDLKLDNAITEEAFKEKNYELERKIKNIQKLEEDKSSKLNKEDNLKSKMEEIKNLLKSHDIITEFDREVFDIFEKDEEMFRSKKQLGGNARYISDVKIELSITEVKC